MQASNSRISSHYAMPLVLRHILMLGLGASVLLTGCTKTDKTEDEINNMEIVADHSANDPTSGPSVDTPNNVIDDTQSVSGQIETKTYLCDPTLKVNATYKDIDNVVVLETDGNSYTLNKTDGENPEVYVTDSGFDPDIGMQWRVAYPDRNTAKVRSTEENTVDMYNCVTSE